MKKLYNKVLFAFILIFALFTRVNAAGTVTASFTSSNTVTVGSTITVNISISNVTESSDGKMYAFGGYIQYDPEYLEYSSFDGANGFTGSINEANHKISLVDYSMSKGASSGIIGSVKFKALKTGTTTLNITTPSATDSSANLTVTFNSKTLTIEPAKSSNSKLASLEIAGFTYTPVFNANTTAYSLTVPNDTEKVTINATAADSKATITGTGEKTLSGNTTVATVKVTAENGSSTSYNITITKEVALEPTISPEPSEKNSDSTLKKLDVSGYTLYPVFNKDETSYSMRVSNNISALNVTALPTEETSTVVISGNKNWVVGNNIISIKVTAEDGSSTTYFVNVTRQVANIKSSDTNVDLRILTSHTIDKEFNNNDNEYEVTVPNDTIKLDLLITPYDKKTKVEVTGNNIIEGVKNPVIITVTAEDGTTKTITLNVVKSEKKDNTGLLDLQVVGHTLNPLFRTENTEYKVNVKNNEDELEIIVKAPEESTVEITGNENFKEGSNTVLVKVTDENNFVKYYKIEVIKAAKSVFTIFGLRLFPFILLLLLLLLLLLIIWLLLRRRKEKVVINNVEPKSATPVIDFKPEFNFNSKNDTDDDVLYANGNLLNGTDTKKLPTSNKVIDAQEADYDIYDDVVTKDELIDAINEGMETKNTEKLEMLLDQEKLNRKKEEMKKRDEKDNY